MRLDELKWQGHNGDQWEDAELGFAHIWRSKGRYDIWHRPSNDWWQELDALDAQCILFELAKPCPVADPS